jgi:hypothetical protein
MEKFKIFARAFKFFLLGILVGMGIFAYWCHYTHLFKDEDLKLRLFFAIATPVIIFLAFLPKLISQVWESLNKIKAEPSVSANSDTAAAEYEYLYSMLGEKRKKNNANQKNQYLFWGLVLFAQPSMFCERCRTEERLGRNTKISNQNNSVVP